MTGPELEELRATTWRPTGDDRERPRHPRLAPVGERVGLAFSGGLDTCCAVTWMREQGAVPYAFTADLGQYDEPDVSALPDKAKQYGAEEAFLVDGKDALAREGLAALQCGAFHIQTAGRRYFNTTPLGRAVTGTLLVRAMREHGVEIWGDGSTYKGNDIQRFFRYGLLANPGLRIYKPWLDEAFVSELGGRTGDERVARGARPRRMARRRRRRTRPTRTCSAPRTRRRISSNLGTSMKIVQPIMGVAHWDPAPSRARDGHGRFEHGRPVALNGLAHRRPGRARAPRERDRRPPTASACPIRSKTA